MSKVLVLGRGHMGVAIKWAMEKLGHDVWTVDQNQGDEFKDRSISLDNVTARFGNLLDDEDFDIVISALPYFLNLNMAQHCIHRNIMYCDLGGRVDVSEEINKYASLHKSCVFTDLGLAPGLVNIMGAAAERAVPGGATHVEMMCGGLPMFVNPKNVLQYVVTWSLEGLFNEYVDDCKILKDGEIVTVKGMDGHIDVVTSDGIELEAFYTSGGASHSLDYFKKRGVKNCSYKTLRYPGHRDLIKYILSATDTKEEFFRFIETSVSHQKEKEDLVHIEVMAVNVNDAGMTRSCVKTLTIFPGQSKRIKMIPHQDEFSAMQRATAFSCVSVAHWMLEEEEDAPIMSPLTYEDVPYIRFADTLKELGIELR